MSTDASSRPVSSLSSVFHQFVRYLLAPLALSFSGFHITDFLLSGVYSWPRTSRILILFLAVVILTYEFVYKENHSQMPLGSKNRGSRVVLISCVIPFLVGSLALVFLSFLSP